MGQYNANTYIPALGAILQKQDDLSRELVSSLTQRPSETGIQEEAEPCCLEAAGTAQPLT